MKPSNKSIKSDTSTKITKTKRIVQTNVKIHNSILINILPVLSMITAILPGVFHKTSGIEIAKIGILSLVLTMVITFYIRLNADNFQNKKLTKTIIIIGYLGSIFLLMLVPNPETLSFWMIGGLVIAMLIDNKLGLLLHFNLAFLMGIILSLRPESVIHLLIIGLLMNLLAGALKQKTTIIYASIILLSTNITLSFAINNFIYKTSTNYNYLSSLFSLLVVLVTAFLLGNLYDRFLNNASKEEDAEVTVHMDNLSDPNHTRKDRITAIHMESEQNQDVMEGKVEVTSVVLQEMDLSRNLGVRTSYDILCDVENELIQKLKEHSENLYSHAMRIGDLSYRAAKEIGANELLARAGGLYHEIGKINGKNYIEEGLNIAEDYAFPKELKAILKEHNIKYEKPSSVEAAIVMLSDNVVSTIEYIVKSEENKFTTNKIIDNIFQMRMEKGTFDDSALSLKNFKQLKEFYQKEFS